jgi:2-octaprenyl-6-methoxyphenol hydroxylase
MSEPMKSSLAVVIQGGGPVGLACAAWLLQKNPRINLILIDRNPEGDEQIQSGDQPR